MMKVVICNEKGEYLSMVRGEIQFVKRKQRGIVYDLERDNVEEQIAAVKSRFGAKWSWESLDGIQAVDGLPDSINR